MEGLGKKTNLGGDYCRSCHCFVDDDQGTPPVEQKRLDHHIVYSPLQTSAWISSRGVVPSESDNQREIDKTEMKSNAHLTKK